MRKSERRSAVGAAVCWRRGGGQQTTNDNDEAERTTTTSSLLCCSSSSLLFSPQAVVSFQPFHAHFATTAAAATATACCLCLVHLRATFVLVPVTTNRHCPPSLHGRATTSTTTHTRTRLECDIMDPAAASVQAPALRSLFTNLPRLSRLLVALIAVLHLVYLAAPSVGLWFSLQLN